MLKLMKKDVDLSSLVSLYDEPFSATSVARDFDVRGGEWTLEGEWLTGKNRENSPGMIISKQDFFGPVMLDFEARTVPPCTHDINWMWSGSWNDETNTRAQAYVCGLEGWWDGKVGFEKSPDYNYCCGTKLFHFTPGQIYHIQSGSIGGHIFCLINGQLAIETTDPDPIDQTRFGRIGFEAYCSHIQIRALKVKRLTWQDNNNCYVPEF